MPNTIFISGAAQGIGAATAQRFLQAGWKVGAYDIAPVDYGHPNLRAGYLDVTDADSWDAALAQFADFTGGTLTALDNNAGIITDGPLAHADPHSVAAVIDVNCRGVALGARAAHPYLRATKGAQLVNICSASAIYGQRDVLVYSATKFFVKGFTEGLRLEWRKDGIRVVDVMPLWAKTGLAQVEAKSTRTLGVHITPELVADTVFSAVTPRGPWQRGKIHYGVSAPDKLLYWARSVSTDRISELVNRWIV